MNIFFSICIMNNAMIKYLEKMGQDSKRNQIIKSILEDEACFFKMNKEEAFVILRQVGIIEENLEEVYNELISKKIFFDLMNNGKVDVGDTELIIKYQVYNCDELFKNKKR